MRQLVVFFLLLLGVPVYGNVRVTVDSTSLDFGSHAVGSGKQLVLHATNTDSVVDIQVDDIKPVGLTAGDFQVLAPSGFPTVISHNTALSIIVSFRAGALGTRSAQLSIITSDGEILVPMRGAGEGEVSEVSLSASSIDFGTIALAGWRDTLLELRSIGRDSATIHDVQIMNSNGDTTFGVWFADRTLKTPFKLATGDSVAIIVQFNGLTVGAATGAIVVFGGTKSTPACALNGDVELGLLAFQPPIVDFGSLNWGESRDTTVRLVNTGEVDITVSDVEPLSDAEFTILSQFAAPFLLHAGEGRDIVLRATPALKGAHFAQLQVGSASTVPLFHYLNLSFTVSGSMPLSAPSQGIASYHCAKPGTVGITVPVDDTGTRSFTITNISASDTGIVVMSDSSLPITLSAGEHRPIGVHFDPSRAASAGFLVLQFSSGGGIVLLDTIVLQGIASQASSQLVLTLPAPARGSLDVRTADLLASFALDTLVVHIHSMDENVAAIVKSSIRLAPGLSNVSIISILPEPGGFAVCLASSTPIAAPAGSPLVTFDVNRYVSLRDSTNILLAVESPERGACLEWSGDTAHVPAATACLSEFLRDVMSGTAIILDANLIENPISNNVVGIAITASRAAEVSYTVSTALGQVVGQEAGHLIAGGNGVLLPLGDLPSGVYYVRVASAGQTRSIRIVKQD